MKHAFLMLFLLLTCSSCKYQRAGLKLGNDSIVEIAIPVIKKDPNGTFRNALAREISFNDSLYYKTSDAKYNLNVSVTEDKDSVICFMWDRDPATNERLDVYYNTEGMKEVVVKVELTEAATEKSVVGPFFLTESSIYDFVNPTVAQTLSFPDGGGPTQSALQYSLGQLDSEEGAKAETYNPTFNKLARKIISRLLRNPSKSNK